jgi:hypothetical protein
MICVPPGLSLMMTLLTKKKKKLKIFGTMGSRRRRGRCGTAWLFDGDHNWEIEDDHVAILGPVKIDLLTKMRIMRL